MPYFRREGEINLLFVHIPKTGGSSVEKYLQERRGFGGWCRNGNPIPKRLASIFGWIGEEHRRIIVACKEHSTWQHLTLGTILAHKEVFGIEEEGLQMLAIVRNPYERAVSAIIDNRLARATSTPDEVFAALRCFVDATCRKYDAHNLPQYRFLVVPDADAEPRLHPGVQILRTESLKEDMAGAGFTDFDMHTNRGPRVDYYAYLNADAIALINEVYALDFRLFGYAML